VIAIWRLSSEPLQRTFALFWPAQRSPWKTSMGCGLAEKRVPEELGDFQGSPPTSSRMVHPDE